MATLYNNKDSNIFKTWALFTIFLIVVIAFGYFLSYMYNDQAILIIAVIFSVGMSFFSYWFSDKIVLKMAKAIPVTREQYFDLYNIVENLSITAGLPMPKIYIINEEAPNAFATGRDPEHAVVAVTSGILKKLNRAELEGVIAHELSHIGNRDMLLSTVIVVLVGFVSIASDMFMRSMFWGGGRSHSNSDDRNGGNQIFMIIGIVLMILTPIVASLIQMAISRKREFLADASGALLTRYPEGLADALIKISADLTPLSVARAASAHLWLANPFNNKKSKLGFSKLFLTHPPIEDRVKALRGMKI